MESTKARKQRKYLFNAGLHEKRKWIASHLEEGLLLKYDKRAIPVIKGDTVKVMRGNFRGHEDKVAQVNVKEQTIEIEGITMTKAKGDKIARPIHPSNVMITKLNLTDKWRRKNLERGLSEDAKKEIEKEAERQLEEVKAEEKIKEEEQKILEETKEEAEKEPAEPAEKEIEEKEAEKKPAPKIKPKKEGTKKKTTTPKKQTEKKNVKKTPAETTKKEEESK
jgi:large subunit ribosomal protein L24